MKNELEQQLEKRLAEIMPLFEEARDALTAITLASAKLHRVDLSLAERMDEVGTKFWRKPVGHEIKLETCEKGRECPSRLYTLNTDGSDSNAPFSWFTDLLYSVIFISGTVVLGMLIAFFIVLATGLHRVLF